MGKPEVPKEPVITDVLPGSGTHCRLISGCGDPAAALAVVSAASSAALVVADSNVVRLHPGFLKSLEATAGHPVTVFEFESGESSKTLETVERCCGLMAENSFDRNCVVIGFGGGVATDLAGMVAGLWMRGVSLIQVPTSVVAMADAAIGGKAAVNLPLGRNLVGLWNHPAYVLLHAPFLRTLPLVERAAGTVEILKTAFIADRALFDACALPVAADDPDALAALAFRAAAVKAGIVAVDPADRAVRRLLNFGHTVGHAIEAVSCLTIGHGAAVAAGMAVEAAIAVRLGRMSPDAAAKLTGVLEQYGLVSRPALDPEALYTFMSRDKKNESGAVRMALPDGSFSLPLNGVFETVAVPWPLFMECWND